MSRPDAYTRRLLHAATQLERAEVRTPHDSPRLRAMRATYAGASHAAVFHVEQGHEDAGAFVAEAEWAGMRLVEAMRAEWALAKQGGR